MTQVSQQEFFDAVNKSAATDPMPTRDYLPIVEKGRTVGQRMRWEMQRGGRALFGETVTIYGEIPNKFYLNQ